MESGATRPTRRYQSSWSIAQTRAALEDALHGGPTLVFADIKEVPANIALVISTSGSTGQPKDVALTAEAVLKSADLSNKFLGAQHGDSWSLHLPVTHAAGINVLSRSIRLGTEISDAGNFTAIVPTQLYRALNGDQNLLNYLKSCEAVLVGGAATEVKLLKEAEKLGINCVTTYGMTETSGGCVYNGQPLEGIEIRIRETVQIKSPTLAAGYLNGSMPMEDGYFVTQDLGRLVDGRLEILGRVDDVIISGGKNISLSAVEKLLGPNVAAYGKSDLEWGTSLNLAVVGPFNASELQRRLSDAFGIKARSIKEINEIPRGGLGKIDRVTLGKLFA